MLGIGCTTWGQIHTPLKWTYNMDILSRTIYNVGWYTNIHRLRNPATMLTTCKRERMGEGRWGDESDAIVTTVVFTIRNV